MICNKYPHGFQISPRVFAEHLASKLESFGWTRLQSEPCLFAKFSDGSLQDLCLHHMDDLLFVGSPVCVETLGTN